MVTTEALKLLYQKLGGTADVENVTAISEMVDLIEDVAGTSSSGASGLLVTMTYDSETEVTTLDKTFAEIKASVEAGIVPVFVSIEEATAGEFWHIDYLCRLSGGADGGECQVILYYYWPSDDLFYTTTFYASTTTSVLTDTAPSSGEDAS